MTTRPSHRTRRLIAVVALGGLVLTACGGGTPDEKRVALEVIESMGADHEGGTLTDAQQDCMVERVEENYTEAELAAIGDANLDLDRANVDFDTEGTDDLTNFFEDLRTCVTEGGAETPSTTGETGTTTEGGEPGTTTSGSATTVPATTVPATTVPATTEG